MNTETTAKFSFQKSHLKCVKMQNFDRLHRVYYPRDTHISHLVTYFQQNISTEYTF